jgi:hypothetical protein
MKLNWTRLVSSLTSIALISACSGGYAIETPGDSASPSSVEAPAVDSPVEEVPAEPIATDPTPSDPNAAETPVEALPAEEVPGEELPAEPPAADAPADEDGTVLGTSWQALSYANCTSPTSDPDGDGWGWESDRPCIAEAPAASSGSNELCENGEGTASTMAALAVSAAIELGRWQPTRDFAIARQNDQELLVITDAARARCIDGCANTQALLDFQKDDANGVVTFPGGVALDSVALRSRMVAKFRDQIACEMQPSNGGTTNCPVEEHTLTFQRSEKGGCDTKYYFVARKPDSSPLQFPAQLKNKLLWADRVNPYIGFESIGEVVSIDPTFGLNERGSTTTGACSASCVKIGLADAEGDCCQCGGVNGHFARSPWSSVTYLCQ